MRYLFIALSFVAVASCGPRLTPFTQELYDQYRWSEDELKRVQFYLSEDIVLQRRLSGGKSEIIRGEVTVIDGKKVELIRIPEGTPGLLEFIPKANRFAVSFEEGPGERFLMFGPNPKYGERYMLLASEWERNRGKVQYEGKYWYTTPGDQLATLMIDLKKVNKTEVRSRVAEGKKVND